MPRMSVRGQQLNPGFLRADPWDTLCVYAIEVQIMKKKLIKHGNSLALVIDKPILDLLQIGEGTPLEVTSDGDRLMVSPIRSKARQRKLRESLEKINERFSDDLRRLAE